MGKNRNPWAQWAKDTHGINAEERERKAARKQAKANEPKFRMPKLPHVNIKLPSTKTMLVGAGILFTTGVTGYFFSRPTSEKKTDTIVIKKANTEKPLTSANTAQPVPATQSQPALSQRDSLVQATAPDFKSATDSMKHSYALALDHFRHDANSFDKEQDATDSAQRVFASNYGPAFIAKHPNWTKGRHLFFVANNQSLVLYRVEKEKPDTLHTGSYRQQ